MRTLNEYTIFKIKYKINLLNMAKMKPILRALSHIYMKSTHTAIQAKRQL